MQRSKDFKDTIKELKRQALINFFIQQKVDGASEVTRSEVEAFYNANPQQFSAYEARNLSHILLKTQSEAKNAASVKKG